MENKSKSGYLFIVMLFALSCSKETQEDFVFDEKFKEVVTLALNSNDSIIHLRGVSSFEWDEVFIFKPYTSTTEIDKTLGFKWEGSESTKINNRDGYNLFVFVAMGEVVKFSNVSRTNGDFTRLTKSGPFSKESTFKVKLEPYAGNQKWIFIYN